MSMSGADSGLFDDPRSALIFAHAAGALEPATALLAAAMADLDKSCARDLRTYEAAGGALLDQIAPAPLAPHALDDVLARLDRPAPAKAPARARPFDAELNDLPACVRRAASRSAGAGWRLLGPGVKGFDLHTGGSAQAQLLRIEPGSGAPTHSHGGVELTLCLVGAFRDERGRYGPGDLAIATPDDTHRPIAEPGPTCIALAVTDAPLRFTGWLGFLQRAFRGAE